MQNKIIDQKKLTDFFCRDIETHFPEKAIAAFKPYQAILTKAVDLLELVPKIQAIGNSHLVLPSGKLTWLSLIAMAYDQIYCGNYLCAQNNIRKDTRLTTAAQDFLIDLMILTHHIYLKEATPEMVTRFERHVNEPGLGAP